VVGRSGEARVRDDRDEIATLADFHAAPDQDIWIRFPSDKIRWIDRDSGKTLLPDLDKLMA